MGQERRWTQRKYLEGVESLRQKNKGVIPLNSYNQLEQWQPVLYTLFKKWTCMCHRHVSSWCMAYAKNVLIIDFVYDPVCVFQFIIIYHCIYHFRYTKKIRRWHIQKCDRKFINKKTHSFAYSTPKSNKTILKIGSETMTLKEQFLNFFKLKLF